MYMYLIRSRRGLRMIRPHLDIEAAMMLERRHLSDCRLYIPKYKGRAVQDAQRDGYSSTGSSTATHPRPGESSSPSLMRATVTPRTKKGLDPRNQASRFVKRKVSLINVARVSVQVKLGERATPSPEERGEQIGVVIPSGAGARKALIWACEGLRHRACASSPCSISHGQTYWLELLLFIVCQHRR